MSGTADNLLIKSIAAIVVLSVWLLPVAHGMQGAQACPLNGQASASAESCCQTDCCVASSCCVPLNDTPSRTNGEDDQPAPCPTDGGCGCPCCDGMMTTSPIMAPVSAVPLLIADLACETVLRSDSTPEGVSLGVAVQPPIA